MPSAPVKLGEKGSSAIDLFDVGIALLDQSHQPVGRAEFVHGWDRCGIQLMGAFARFPLAGKIEFDQTSITQGEICVRQIWIEIERLLGRLSAGLQIRLPIGHVIVLRQEEIGIGEPRLGQRKLRIEAHRLFQVSDRAR
jgi:hypothetical protein